MLVTPPTLVVPPTTIMGELVVSLEMFSTMKLGYCTLLVKKAPEFVDLPSTTDTQGSPALSTMQKPTVLH